MDFTFNKYQELLNVLVKKEYSFQTFGEYLKNPKDKVILLRHDVEKRLLQSIEFARIENSLGIKGSYYFKFASNGIDREVIKEIRDLGHEIGYHYDDLSICKGDLNKAIDRFKQNLSKLRELSYVETICMDGAPLSKFDNRDLWKTYDFKEYGIIGEPYLSTDFNKVLYLTDTGRMWDGHNVSFRDRITHNQKSWNNSGFRFHSTNDIINSVENSTFPDVVMITSHPQRWTSNILIWTHELIYQKLKNIIKRILIKE